MITSNSKAIAIPTKNTAIALYPYIKGLIKYMALKPAKATAPPEAVAQCTSPDFDFESMIADELLDNIDWSKVKIAMLQKVKQKFFDWLTTGDRPINLSPYPELSALPSADDEVAS